MSAEQEADFLRVVGDSVPAGTYYNLLADYVIDQVRSSFRSKSDFERYENGSLVESGAPVVQRFVDRCLIRLWNQKCLHTDKVRFKVEEVAPAGGDGRHLFRWVAEPLPDEA